MEIKEFCELNSSCPHFIVIDKNSNFYAKTYSVYDARLIAAAPELLEALESIVDSIDKGKTIIRWSAKYVSENGLSSCERNMVERARAAIAKARGEQ